MHLVVAYQRNGAVAAHIERIRTMQRAVWLLCSSFLCYAADTFIITQDKQVLAPGDKVHLQVKSLKAGDPPPKVSWNISPLASDASDAKLEDTAAELSYAAPESVEGPCRPVSFTATAGTESHTAFVHLTNAQFQEPCPGGNIVTSIIGYEQAGGSSAKSDQRFFFDIFDSRPLPIGNYHVNGDVFGPAWRWWANVRVASYPQQISTTVAQFASGFATQVGNLPVNKLASFGEFRAGIERRVAGFRQAFLPVAGGTAERTSLGAIAYFGGLANLDPPSNRVDVYQIPAAGTPQRAAFDGVFPAAKYPILSLPTAQYLGVTTPDHGSFYWQYAAGFRLTTRLFDTDGTEWAAPAIFSFAMGQNELVTGGHRRGLVGTFEGFYPLPLTHGKSSGLLYLFGRADLHLGRANVGTTPLVLNPALDSQGNPVPPTNANVAIIAMPSNRDLYSIGVGVDAIQIINALVRPAKNTPKN